VWNAPEFLESLRAQSEKFTVADGSTQTLALKFTPPSTVK
jgi:hypothetical protein